MEHTYEELKHKKVVELREIAKDVPVQGYTQMNKEHLIKAVCDALGIDMFAHHVAHTTNKPTLKNQIHSLKKKRDKILSSKKRDGLRAVLTEIRNAKRKLRKAAV